ncbi:MAG: hypothetical protein OMM_12299, partial [Candidatus Magnetoglobus multicellularis str. Araruama]
MEKVLLTDQKGLVTEFFDKSKNKYTHYVAVDHLKENTRYSFSVASGEVVDKNNGKMYHVVTGPELIPVGSLQPAGQVLMDNQTPAKDSIVYIRVINDHAESAIMSTLVDQNGFWFLILSMPEPKIINTCLIPL